MTRKKTMRKSTRTWLATSTMRTKKTKMKMRKRMLSPLLYPLRRQSQNRFTLFLTQTTQTTT